MSIESAAAYIRRMRADAEFRRKINDLSDDQTASWEEIRRAGYEFTIEEFKAAQEEVQHEVQQQHGVTPDD